MLGVAVPCGMGTGEGNEEWEPHPPLLLMELVVLRGGGDMRASSVLGAVRGQQRTFSGAGVGPSLAGSWPLRRTPSGRVHAMQLLPELPPTPAHADQPRELTHDPSWTNQNLPWVF